MSPRPRNPDAREALLASARVEFARHGLDGARIEDVTRRAGLSKGAFYLHFRSKEEAFRLLVERLLGALEEQVNRRHDEQAALEAELGPLGSDAERLEQVIQTECRWDTAMLEVLWHNRQVVAAVDSAASRPVARLLDGFRRRVSATVATNLRVLQDRGQMRAELDPVASADLIVGAYEAFGRRMAALREKPDLAAWSLTVLKVFYLGVLGPAGPGAAPQHR